MITEDKVEAALFYLVEDPHPVAIARFNLAKAENHSKALYSRLFLTSNQPNNDLKRASVECNAEYMEAKTKEADCIFEYERHRARVKGSETVIECWRTDNANARAAEKIR